MMLIDASQTVPTEVLRELMPVIENMRNECIYQSIMGLNYDDTQEKFLKALDGAKVSIQIDSEACMVGDYELLYYQCTPGMEKWKITLETYKGGATDVFVNDEGQLKLLAEAEDPVSALKWIAECIRELDAEEKADAALPV